ncbi:hypothetical protein BKA70DRAFT_1431792 [Coprinopsis sp. MPI-PUGE-AT-0042]|nr:hypothetical protein BKA70DRAFT_1431792 [Coprinopsis sp. MPI-PUGE-AT-0042]
MSTDCPVAWSSFSGPVPVFLEGRRAMVASLVYGNFDAPSTHPRPKLTVHVPRRTTLYHDCYTTGFPTSLYNSALLYISSGGTCYPGRVIQKITLGWKEEPQSYRRTLPAYASTPGSPMLENAWMKTTPDTKMLNR